MIANTNNINRFFFDYYFKITIESKLNEDSFYDKKYIDVYLTFLDEMRKERIILNTYVDDSFLSLRYGKIFVNIKYDIILKILKKSDGDYLRFKNLLFFLFKKGHKSIEFRDTP